MTNDEIRRLVDRLRTLRPGDPTQRGELVAALPMLRAHGGPAARLADELDAALRDWEQEATKIDAATIIDIARLQSMDN